MQGSVSSKGVASALRADEARTDCAFCSPAIAPAEVVAVGALEMVDGSDTADWTGLSGIGSAVVEVAAEEVAAGESVAGAAPV